MRRAVMLAPVLARRTYSQKITSLFGASLIGYWKQAEASGTTSLDSSGNGRNGTYSNVTLAQPGIGDGLTVASYNGTTSFDNVYSTSLDAAFTPGEFTVIAWGKVSAAADWTDATAHTFMRLAANASNDVRLRKSSTNNTLSAYYNAGGTAKESAVVCSAPTDFFMVGMTVSKSNDRLRLYFQGAQLGANVTGLGTWAGVLASTLTVIGSLSTTPSQSWKGLIGHVAVLNREATAAEMATAGSAT